MHIFACIPSTSSIRARAPSAFRGVEGPQSAGILVVLRLPWQAAPYLLGGPLASSIPAPQPSKPPPPSPPAGIRVLRATTAVTPPQRQQLLSCHISSLEAVLLPPRWQRCVILTALTLWRILLSFSFSSCSASPAFCLAATV